MRLSTGLSRPRISPPCSRSVDYGNYDPGRPREYDPRSREGEIYAALEQLPDDYYVVHSYTLLSTINDEVRENEADFVVFHKDRGLVCIEAKAGRVGYSDGEWRYASGRAMRHGGRSSRRSA